MRKIVMAFCASLTAPRPGLAQQLPDLGGRSTMELYLSLAVLVFGLIILGLQIGLMFKIGKGWGPNTIRVTGLTLVIVSGVFLITAGYSQDQIAPMVGLLGTIAGYLLGKSEKQE